MIVFSIIICTYNPNPEIFQRLLDAVLQLDNIQVEHEVILVDNNSSPAIALDNGVQSFLLSKKNAVVIKEAQPGLTNARIAGIKASKADWIIFFDDDNEPTADYLVEAQKIIQQFPQVGVWGPGNIEVDYIGRQTGNYLENLKPVFQQRVSDQICFDNNIVEGNACYPYGTGMIIKKNILTAYIHEVEKGNLTMSDRSGDSLLSGGDSQMLYIALRMEYFAGSAPLLKMVHNILPGKTRLRTVLKLLYSVNAGQVKAYNEVFTTNPYQVVAVNNKMIVSHSFTLIKRVIKKPWQLIMELIEFSKKLGTVKAQVVAGNAPTPFLLSCWELFIRF